MSNQKKEYIPIYTKEDYEKDESDFNKSMANEKPINWSSFKRLMTHDLCVNNVIETGFVGKHKLEDVCHALEHPKHGYRVLIDTSDYLMRTSPHYYRLNSLYSNISMFCWWLDIYDLKEGFRLDVLKKKYDMLAGNLEKMNLKHEFSKITKVLPYQDIYCGLVVENQNDFFIQHIDFKMCKLKQVQDGLYNFAIDLSRINPINISAYPDYIQIAYIDFREGRITDRWYIPPPEKQICIKMNSQWTFPMPILINLIKDIFDLDIYKKLKLQSARTDNYKAILVEVPIDEKTVDKPLLTPDTLGIFAEINKESMSDDIGLIHTVGSKGEAISFKDSSNTRNNVADAIDDIYDSAGITKELFNGSSSGTAVSFSVENDSGFLYGVYRQFERWVNRYIKLNKYNQSTFKFLFYLLDITALNKDKVIDRYKNACTVGVSAKGQYLAALDMTPSRTKGSFIMEQEIFNFQENFIPLSTSYTQSSEDVGRPTNESQNKELSDSGEKTKVLESNTKR